MDYKKEYEEKLSKAITLHKLAAETNNDNTRMALEELYPELKESEDDIMRKMAIHAIYSPEAQSCIKSWGINPSDVIVWLEKVGKQKPNPYSGTSFEYNGHIWGMCARDNGVDILLDSQFLKHFGMLGEQTSTNKIEPKFKVGDTIVEKDLDECGYGTIVNIKDGKYIFDDGWSVSIKEQELWQLVKQKPSDKVEPKFNVGDWIVEPREDKPDYLWYIDRIKDDCYWYDAISAGVKIAYANKECHLWTIQDAKDGDVLAAHDCLVLFKEIDGLNIKCYCTYHFMNNQMFHVDTLQNKNAFSPATKEQRELLFSKMKEARYEWDAEKKELKKIERKSSWSEEDDKKRKGLIKGLEDRMGFGWASDPFSREEYIDWLKSLKPNHWKPSDEQMEVLNWCKPLWNEPKTKAVLESLIEDLKKLKGE